MMALASSLKAAFVAELQWRSLSYLERSALYRRRSSSVRKHGALNLKVLPFLCVFQVGHSIMRVSLNLKADSRSDFGVQTRWDSRGARVQFIQPGETLAFFFFFLLARYSLWL